MDQIKNKKILVTGGGGFLGFAIVRDLIAKGCEVRSFSRCSYLTLKKLGVEQIQGDIADSETVDSAIKGMDIVFHVAARAGIWGKYENYYRPNVIGTQNVIDACIKHGVKGLVHTSSPSVVFDGKDMEGTDESAPYPAHFHTHYPKTKAIAEQLVKKAAKNGLPSIILRPHLIWGPEDNHLVPRILSRARSLVRVGDGKNLVDTIYITNAAHAHILAAQNIIENPSLSGNVYFISQDEPIPLWDMVNHILETGGLNPVSRSIPASVAFIIGTISEFVYKMFRIKTEPKLTRFLAKEFTTSHWFDISAAKKDLGYKPKVSTKEGLALLAEWIKSNQR
ncbi:NAD-dependent epimerase/dehydratase family protein [Desulfobacterales bacterium HSG16]|nr:NAD-dependent epimerase/dehydratase family protein [Desulfobacterales bacterium HSG16]